MQDMVRIEKILTEIERAYSDIPDGILGIKMRVEEGCLSNIKNKRTHLQNDFADSVISIYSNWDMSVIKDISRSFIASAHEILLHMFDGDKDTISGSGFESMKPGPTKRLLIAVKMIELYSWRIVLDVDRDENMWKGFYNIMNGVQEVVELLKLFLGKDSRYGCFPGLRNKNTSDKNILDENNSEPGTVFITVTVSR